MSREYETELDGLPLRQGDVFVWAEHEHQRPWRAYGVVVTADCDLAGEKVQGRVSYVPALSTIDYIWEYWREQKFRSVLELQIKTMSKRLNKWISTNRQDTKPISDDTFCSWADRVGADALLEEMGVTANDQKKSLKVFIESYADVRNLMSSNDPDLSLLSKCWGIKTGKPATSKNDMISAFQDSASSLPGDIFHLSTNPTSDDDGIFISLRHINQCAIDDIALRPDDLRYGTARARRLARIAPPYKFAMMQNLARVFSDIGLPATHPNMKRTSVDNFFEKRGGM